MSEKSEIKKLKEAIERSLERGMLGERFVRLIRNGKLIGYRTLSIDSTSESSCRKKKGKRKK